MKSKIGLGKSGLRVLTGFMMLIASMKVCYAAAQFDLRCQGTVNFRRTSASMIDVSAPLDIRFRVDTVSRRYCIEPCTTVKPIASITADKIVLHAYDLWHDMRQSEIDRVAGQLRIYGDCISYGDTSCGRMDAQAHCTPLPFTGLPLARF
jgi:hypothetical protein